jgi:hypothetical protein
MGFTTIDTPAEVREQRLDDRQITNLQNIQYQIENQLSLTGELPATVSDLKITGEGLPTAPEGRDDYTYSLTENGFELCATFAYPSKFDEFSRPFIDDAMLIKNRDNWSHDAGRYCFERVVDIEPATPKLEISPN